MERNFLEELGLDKEVINSIMAEYGKSIQQYKDSASSQQDLQSRIEELEKANKALESAKAQAEDNAQNGKASLDEMEKALNSEKLANLRTRVALEQGLSYSFADRLRGDDEESLTKDAQALSAMVHRGGDPLRSTENAGATAENPYANLARQLVEGD